MPAWMTSLLRELTPVPKLASASRTSGASPREARSAATASPTAPAPITIVSTVSMAAALVWRRMARPSRGVRAAGSGRVDGDREVDRVRHEAVAMRSLVELREAILVLGVELDPRSQGHRHEAGLAVFLATELADAAVAV